LVEGYRCTAKTQYRKFGTNLARKGIARHHSQFFSTFKKERKKERKKEHLFIFFRLYTILRRQHAHYEKAEKGNTFEIIVTIGGIYSSTSLWGVRAPHHRIAT
jgi:hypothetical protein